MSKPNPFRIDPIPNSARMWGMNARASHFDNHCHRCSRCFTEAGGWNLCESSRCDSSIPYEDVMFWEDATETVERSGLEPLNICQYVGCA